VPILLDARPWVDKIVAWQMRHQHPDVYTWPPLQSADPNGAFEPLLDCVIRTAKQYGWLPSAK
jgi:hypothetical protein